MSRVIAEPSKPVRLESFPPLEPVNARLLILGSMPGVASLKAQQYYAHRQNRFWPFMEAICGITLDASSYDARVRALLDRGVAVWDVLKHCERPGSLDAHIVRDSECPNDFAAFLDRQPKLRAIALNGRTADAAFRRHAVPMLGEHLNGITLIPLPSTSPANASQTTATKLHAWSQLRVWLADPLT